MAKWWLLSITYPEGATDTLQIYADTADMARTAAGQWLKLDGGSSVTIRDSSDNPFTNPVITSSGVQNAPGSTATPPSTSAPPPTPPPGPPVGPFEPIPENEPSAQFTRGLQERGVNLNTISGRAQSRNQGDYLNSFAFQSLLQGLNPNVKNFGGEGLTSVPQDAFQRFARETDIGGVRRGAASALRDLIGSNVGPQTQSQSYLQGQFGQPTSGQAGALSELAQSALASRISPLALQLLNLPSGNDLRDRFLAQGGQGSFLDYFRQQYPLMGLGI